MKNSLLFAALTVSCSYLACTEKKPAKSDDAPMGAPAEGAKQTEAKAEAKPEGAAKSPEQKPAYLGMSEINPDAKEVFSTRCATCHGALGHGDGLAAAALNPKPRDMTDPAWQKSVTDDHIRKVMVEGGASVGKSPLMAPNPDLKDKKAVIDGLVKIVRSFQKS